MLNICAWMPGIGILAVSIATLSTISCIPSISPPEKLDYRDSVEGAAGMYIEDLASPNAKLYNLGETSLAGVPQYAIKFGTDPEIEDSGTKNSILIECGMHAREWFAAESCYWLVDHLIANRDEPEIQDLLESVDIWILPQSNPAGRQFDDLRGGDPTQFIHVCKGGSDEGEACTNNSDCNSNDCYGAGWRTNANDSVCPVGVDLARNFSSGWGAAVDVCSDGSSSAHACEGSNSWFMKYRGPHPFSEPETLNLRRFVHNHMVSTVLIVHTNSQEISNRWAATSTANDSMVDELVNINSTGVGSDTEAEMRRTSVGGGCGQFSAWLTQPSNEPGELDLNTERNISTFYFELPISGNPNPYYTGDYQGDDYRFTAGDGSNSFHPSSSVWYRLFTDSILPMMINVIRQAGSPQCPLDDGFVRMTSSCETNDFGLVGMKIAHGIGEPGALDFDPGTREEILVEGSYDIVFAIQNFSGDPANTDTNAVVRVYRDGSVVTTRSQAISLGTDSRDTYTVEQAFDGGHSYRVEISLDSDDFTNDNDKSMAFRVERRPMRAPPLNELLVEDLEVRPLEPGVDRWVVEGQLSYSGKLPDRLPATTVELVIFPPRSAAVPKPLVWKSPIQIREPGEERNLSKHVSETSSAKSAGEMANMELVPQKKRSTFALRIIVDDPAVVKALAAEGTVAMRITMDGHFSAYGVRASKVAPLLKVDPKNAEEDPEDEP